MLRRQATPTMMQRNGVTPDLELTHVVVDVVDVLRYEPAGCPRRPGQCPVRSPQAAALRRPRSGRYPSPEGATRGDLLHRLRLFLLQKHIDDSDKVNDNAARICTD